MTDNLVLDITSESQLAPYSGGNQRVGFYDGFIAGNKERPALYIYIRNVKDRTQLLRRKAGTKIVGGQEVLETKLYATAYAKYLELKSSMTPKKIRKKPVVKNEDVAKPVANITDEV